ncbi:MAG: inner membrane protein [Planctomycetota bacterium]|jgi:inner membrane protein
MDLLTQGLLGGVLAQSVADRDEKKLATLAGIAAGLLADADILIRSSSDPLLNVEYHRHFSHSLLFIPLGAALAAMLLWPFLRRRISTRKLYVFCLAGYSLSGLLDACTSYGTQLFWPFSDERVAFNIISIIDPIFTLSLLAALLSGLWFKHRVIAFAGISFALSYLLFGYSQLQEAKSIAAELISSRGHVSQQQLVKPTLGNLLLWRSVYIFDERIYVDAVRVGIFKEDKIYEGESLKLFSLETDLRGLDMESTLYKDIERFTRFSDGFVAFDPAQAHVIGDIRYSMLPMSGKPLWGIVIDPFHVQQHADYRFFRDGSRETRSMFIDLVLGRDE